MRMIIHKKYYKNIIAGAVVLCVLGVDAHMFGMFSKDYVITEKHDMDIAMADGKYDGDDSDSPNSEEIPVVVREESEETQHVFNVLEILPTEKKGVIGYTIAGHEPFEKANGDPILPIRDSDGETILATESMLREAYMDAVINEHPGIDNANRTNNSTQLVKDIVGNMSAWLKESGTSSAFNIDADGHVFNGYYKYVGPDKGVFAKGEIKKWNQQWKEITPNYWGNVWDEDQEMFSRFYNYDSKKHYDYIFVYSNDESGDPRDINVKNHRRIKYENNNRFLRDCLGVSEDQFATWRDKIEVSTRNPHSVSLQDIEKADLIVINNGNNMGYHKLALEIYNLTHQYMLQSSERDLDRDNGIVFSQGNDFDDVVDDNGTVWPGFEKSIRIYERVAVREDAAFITSKNCISGKTFDTNIRKLMCMLFYVCDDKNTERDDKGVELRLMAGSGREFFMDFMKRYVSEPGKYKIGIGDNPNKTYWDLRQENDRYIAKTLRDDKPNNYMHYHWNWLETHPGHPLTTNINDARTRGYFSPDGILVNVTGETEPGNVIRRTIRRQKEQYYIDLGIPKRDDDHPDGYYESESLTSNEPLVSESQAKNHKWCLDGYESMSNATDYMYIDDEGNLQRDGKFSGDNGYWFKCDYDDGDDWYAFKKIKWAENTWTTWPWDAKMEEWLMAKGHYERDGSTQGNMHLYYDYYDANFPPYAYRGLDDIDPGKARFKNQCLVEENAMLKADHIKKVLVAREKHREDYVEKHVVSKDQDCFVSMNILNGDGVNKQNKNKVLYYNSYEAEQIKKYEIDNPKKARIPIKIRIKTSCPLESIVVSDKDGTISSYIFNDSNKNVGTDVDTITCVGSKGKTLKMDRAAGTYREPDKVPITKDAVGITIEDKTTHGNYKYSYEGLIYDVTNDKYLNKRNEEVTVTITVKDQNNISRAKTDKVYIVQRDYFMLN